MVLVSGHVDTEQTWSANVIICPILGLQKAFYSIKENDKICRQVAKFIPIKISHLVLNGQQLTWTSIAVEDKSRH